MTVAVAWVRALPGDCEELLMVTDSRLRGGRTIDCCPKIITSPRSDCAICFAGDTNCAYPLMLQLYFAIDNHYPSRTRALDVTHLKKHVLNICNQFLCCFVENLSGDPDVSLVLGGYSWVHKKFKIYHYSYSKHRQMIECQDVKGHAHFGKIVIAGDWKKKAKESLYSILYNCGGFSDKSKKFDMEPFVVVRDLLTGNKSKYESIGGPPQLVKVYQHMNCRSFGVFWPDINGTDIALSGRLLQQYERVDCRVMDPYDFMTYDAEYALGVRNDNKVKSLRGVIVEMLRRRRSKLAQVQSIGALMYLRYLTTHTCSLWVWAVV